MQKEHFFNTIDKLLIKKISRNAKAELIHEFKFQLHQEAGSVEKLKPVS